jgi:hypothetical protein
MKYLLDLPISPNEGVAVFIQNKRQPLLSIGKVSDDVPDAAGEASTGRGG